MSKQAPTQSQAAVAVIGAGPGGLAAGAWLVRQGFEPVLFEAAARPGGQWNAASPLSAVWPGMRTNTSRVMTAFSDLDHAPETAVYPSQPEMLAYLDRYAEQMSLAHRIRCATQVVRIEPAPAAEGGYLVHSRTAGGETVVERFPRVVVATGRQTMPATPDIPGLDDFAGIGGVVHSAHYYGAEAYRGMRVLVAGGSISAVEIASELAVSGAAAVAVAGRRQRYVVQKLIAGVPAEHRLFNRFAALAGETFPPEACAAGLRDLIVAACGRPEQYGAPAADDDIRLAGVTQSQSYLALVAEGRIRPRPWISGMEGRTVVFDDGRREVFDAVVLATGYRLALPFLAPAITDCVAPAQDRLALMDHTFHPDLPGLAFLGLYELVGPALPVLELQARWIAYAWAGKARPPSTVEMRHGLSRGRPGPFAMHELAIAFARRAGVEPDLERRGRLRRALMFGPLSPASFRLDGPDALPEAPRRTEAAAAAFGFIQDPQMTPVEAAQHRALQDAKVPPQPPQPARSACRAARRLVAQIAALRRGGRRIWSDGEDTILEPEAEPVLEAA